MEGPEQTMQQEIQIKEEETKHFIQTLQGLAHVLDAVGKNHIQNEPSEMSMVTRRECK